MARPRHRRSRRNYSANSGHERARQHIREAEALSRELGGTDQDVKRYFFNLPAPELAAVFEEYRRQFGEEPYSYAVQAFPRWKAGRVQMSGLVASRLFKFLPPRMPIGAKYDLVRSLWSHVCPSSTRSIVIGPDASEAAVSEIIQSHVTETVKQYYIGPQLSLRFNWLAAGDATVTQRLMNYLLEAEKAEAIKAAGAHVPVLFNAIRNNARVTHVDHTVQIGKHTFKLMFRPEASGITEYIPPARERASGKGFLKLALFIAAALILFFVLRK